MRRRRHRARGGCRGAALLDDVHHHLGQVIGRRRRRGPGCGRLRGFSIRRRDRERREPNYRARHYNRLRKKGEVEQAQDTELSLLTEIRNILAETNGQVGKHVSGPGTGPSPDTAKITSADRADKS